MKSSAIKRKTDKKKLCTPAEGDWGSSCWVFGAQLLFLPPPPRLLCSPPLPPSPDRSRQKVAGLPLGSGRHGNAPLFFSFRRPRLSPERWLRMQMAFITAPRSIEKSLTQAERCGREGESLKQEVAWFIGRSLHRSGLFRAASFRPFLSYS